MDLSSPGTHEGDSQLIYFSPQFTSLHLLDLMQVAYTFGFLELLLQVAQTKADPDNIGESLEDDEIKETKPDKENTSK